MPYIGELSALLTACLWSVTSFLFAFASARVGSVQVNINRIILAAIILFLIIISFLTPLALFIFFDYTVWIFLPYITVPFAAKAIKMITTLEGTDLNRTLELTAKLSALFGILFSAGLAL